MNTRDEKVPTLLEVVKAIGKIRLVSWVEEKLKREMGYSTVNMVGERHHVEGASVNVVGMIDQEEGASMNIMGGIDEEEGDSVNVAGSRDQVEIEVPSVMIVDQTEEMRDVTVPVRERFVGSTNPTYVQGNLSLLSVSSWCGTARDVLLRQLSIPGRK